MAKTTAPKDILRLDVPYTTDGDDITVYIDAEELQSQFKEPWSADLQALLAGEGFYEGRVQLRDLNRPNVTVPPGRAMICPCYDGQLYSLTIRFDEPLMGDRPPSGRCQESWGGGDFDPNKHLLSIEEQCTVLSDAIFGTETEPKGLVVVAAQTSAGKSKIVRAIINRVLRHSHPKRRPHLVTYEDPIEAFYRQPPTTKAMTELLQSHCDYTPRQRLSHSTEPTLQTALRNALRQTPTVFFVGEVRNDDDWRALFQFAATGHFVITTTHAGSVTECMKKLLIASSAQTAADRADLAAKLLAVIHLRSCKPPLQCSEHDIRATVPALWRRTPRAVSELVANGLASILPYFPAADNKSIGTLGRRWFVEQMLSQLPKGHLDTRPSEINTEDRFAQWTASLRRTALEWDLEET